MPFVYHHKFQVAKGGMVVLLCEQEVYAFRCGDERMGHGPFLFGSFAGGCIAGAQPYTVVRA